jgi:beta-mannosidase
MRETNRQTLNLLAPLAAGTRALDGEWCVALSDPGQTDDTACIGPDRADAHWKKVRLPHLRYATVERHTLWYRHHFQLGAWPPHERTLLRFGGAFYETEVWLNGVALGAHQGYFQPFGFEVSDLLQAGENVVAVRCRFPVEAGAFKRKTAVAGIFADWDCKPYPSMYYPNLPTPHEWQVPLGLWQPAQLQTTGDVLVEVFNVFPEVIGPDWSTGCAEAANVRVVLHLRNLSAAAQTAHLGLTLAPHNFTGETAGRGDWEVDLEGQTSRRVEFTLTLRQPRLWFPWTHGEPHLYAAALSVTTGDDRARTLTQVFGVRTIEVESDAQRWAWRLNGRRIFPKGSNYISDFYLDRISLEGLSRDLVLAREANLDLLRVHAHISSPELYRLCDEQGLLVMCDFPLIWTYAFGLSPEAQADFRASVQQQTEDMVGLLGSHPSIGLWSMHNEPPWSPDGSFLGADVHAAETNRQMDEAMARQVRALDPTRPVLAASGQYDQHLYYGWYTGHWRDNRNLQPTFPTEFGVQALPNLASPFWETLNTHWPVSSDDPTWAHAGYQSVFWDNPGIGLPAHYASLAEYIQESQAYQAFYIRYTIDQWRRKKFAPVGGYIHFLFTDGWPAITWSTLDYFRLPKAGYHALADVSRPAHVCLDLHEGYGVEGAFHLVYPPGQAFKADLHLVNDDYRLSGPAQLAWWLAPRPGGWLGASLRRALAARVTVDLPGADEGARLVKAVALPLPHPGAYTFHTRLTQGNRVLDENEYDLRVGAAQSRRHAPRRVPGFLVSRVYEFGSLRRTADGFTLKLHNPAMPVLVQHLAELRVDGQLIDPAQVEILHGGQSRRAATVTPAVPLEFSTGQSLTLMVHLPPLPLGQHELEVTAQLFGLGEIAARWRDRLT